MEKEKVWQKVCRIILEMGENIKEECIRCLMPDGKLHSGKTHGKTSQRLYHLKELPKTTQEKIRKRKKKS
jgi:hypothetical protein